MLKRNRTKEIHVINHDMFDSIISTLSKDLKIPAEELRSNVNAFIVSEVSEWKQSVVEIIDETYNIKVIDTGEIIKIENVPLAVLRKIRFFFKNLVNTVRNKNVSETLSENIGKLIQGTIVRATELNVFVNALDNCFKIPVKNFLITDILEENFKYLFYVAKNKDGGEIFLTRVNNEFFTELLKLYIPEIKDGIIEIVKVYRIISGKINVFFKSQMDNAISHCLGGNSDKLQHIMSELSGEKLNFIDIERSFYKAIMSVLRIEKYFSNLIIYRKGGICAIYVDHIITFKILQRQMRHIYALESIFNIQIDLTFIRHQDDYLDMIKTCFKVETQSEAETLSSALPTIRHLYQVCPSVLCVKLLISSTTVESIILALIRTVEDDENHVKSMEKLMQNDNSVFYSKK